MLDIKVKNKSHSTPAKTGRRLALSSASCALALYLAINATIQITDLNNSRRAAAKIGQTSVTQQAFEGAADLLRTKANEGPTCALLGSSLVLAPFWSSDLKHFPNVGDCWHHHASMYMEKNFADAGLGKTGVVNFGLPGLVVSDAYLIAEKIFNGPSKPKYLVYGIAPRDFMDDFLGAHTQTPLFERLVTVPDALQLGDLYFESPQERLDFVLQKVVYLYGKRGRYQGRLSKTASKTVEKIFRAKGAPAVSPEDDSRALGFLLEANRPYVWAASIREYKARYKTFNEVQFERQKSFLKAFLKLTKDRGINTVLVNMPLTDDNMKLMPPGLYDRYMQSVLALAKANGTPLIDLRNGDRFADEYFYDTVHLNARGGDKLAGRLTQYFAEEPASNVQLAGSDRKPQ